MNYRMGNLRGDVTFLLLALFLLLAAPRPARGDCLGESRFIKSYDSPYYTIVTAGIRWRFTAGVDLRFEKAEILTSGACSASHTLEYKYDLNCDGSFEGTYTRTGTCDDIVDYPDFDMAKDQCVEFRVKSLNTNSIYFHIRPCTSNAYHSEILGSALYCGQGYYHPVNSYGSPYDQGFTSYTYHHYTEYKSEFTTITAPSTVSFTETGNPVLSYTVTRDRISQSSATFRCRRKSGTATEGTDFVVLDTGDVTIAAGTASGTCDVKITNDVIAEPDTETVVMEMYMPGGTHVCTGTTLEAAGRSIIDDDTFAVALDSSTYAFDEEDSGTHKVTITTSKQSSMTFDVDLTFSDGSATGGDDYTSSKITVTFPVLTSSVDVTVPVNNDALAEGAETFNVALGNLQNDGTGKGSLGAQTSAVVTIAVSDPFTVDFSSTSYPGTEGSSAEITVDRTGALGSFEVDVTFSHGTAGASDYTSASQTITFASGDTSKVVYVPIANDNDAEPAETFTAGLSNLGGSAGSAGTISGDTSTTVTIAASDSFTVDFSSTTYPGTEGSSAEITVDRTGGLGSFEVDVTFSHGSAGASDYTSATQTITFGSSDTSKVVYVPITDDTDPESAETFTVGLTNLGGTVGAYGTISGDTSTTVTIAESDLIYVGFASAAYAAEEGTGEVLTVTRAGPDGAFTIDVTFATGTALTADFDSSTQSVSFGASDASKTVTVPITDDGDAEAAEDFTATLGNIGGVSASVVRLGATSSTTVTIATSDPITVEFDSATYAAAEGTGEVLKVTRTGGDGAFTIQVTFAAGTASTSDFDDATQTLTFGSTDAFQTLTVPITDDSDAEASEDFTASFGTIGGAAAAFVSAGTTASTTVTIAASDSFTVDFSSTTYPGTEGSSAEITVDRTGGLGSFEVDLTFSHGTAGASDYTSATQKITFASGDTSKVVYVPITDDNDAEPAETFTAGLSNLGGTAAAYGTISGDTSTTVTIAANDPITVQFDSATYAAAEGTGEVLKVTRTGGDGAFTVDVTFATGTALATDFDSSTQTLTFGSTDAFKTLSVPITDDSDAEAAEDFTASVGTFGGAAAAFASVGTTSATTVTIAASDPITIEFAAASYPAAEGTGEELKVTRSGGDGAFTVQVTFAAGTASTSDFDDATQTLTFASTDAFKTLTVPITDDNDAEPSEDFTASFGTISGAAASFVSAGTTASTTVTIVASDSFVVEFETDTYAAVEGTGEVLKVTRAGGDGEFTVEVTFATGGALAADFDSAKQTLTFGSTDAFKTLTVAITDDSDAEAAEDFTATLGNIGGAASAHGVFGARQTATVTIAASDPITVEFDAATYAAVEGTGEVLKVTRTGGNGAFTVDVSFATGTALASDFDSAMQTLTFGSTDAFKTLTVPITDDSEAEAAEDFTGSLGTFGGAAAALASVGTTSTTTVTIAASDPITVEFDVATYAAVEGTGEELKVTRTGGDGAFTVDVTFATGTALAADFDSSTQTLTFGSTDAFKTLSVPITDDSDAEAAEDFTASVGTFGGAAAAFASVGTTSATTVTIAASDPITVQFDSATYTAAEGTGEVLKVTRSGGDGAFTVQVTFAAGTASTSDFDDATQTLTFGSTDAFQTLSVPITDDSDAEPSEDFTASVGTFGGAAAAFASVGTTATTTVTIAASDPFTVVFESATYSADEGTGEVLKVTRTGGNGVFTVDVTFATGTALATDFDSSTQTLSFGSTDAFKTLSVTITDDDIAEAAEDFAASLGNFGGAVGGQGAVGTTGTATVTIAAGDPFAIGFVSPSYTFGEGVGTVSVVIDRDPPSSKGAFDVTVVFSAGTAGGGGVDFDSTPIVVSFGETDTTKSASVPINGDGHAEVGETFTATLTSLVDASGQVTVDPSRVSTSMSITDDDVCTVTNTTSSYHTGSEFSLYGGTFGHVSGPITVVVGGSGANSVTWMTSTWITAVSPPGAVDSTVPVIVDVSGGGSTVACDTTGVTHTYVLNPLSQNATLLAFSITCGGDTVYTIPAPYRGTLSETRSLPATVAGSNCIVTAQAFDPSAVIQVDGASYDASGGPGGHLRPMVNGTNRIVTVVTSGPAPADVSTVTVTVYVGEPHAVTLSPTLTELTLVEGAVYHQATLSLTQFPTAPVTVSVASTVASVLGVTPAEIVFATGTKGPTVLRLEALDNSVDAPASQDAVECSFTLAMTTTDTIYATVGLPTPPKVTVTDNDVAAISVVVQPDAQTTTVASPTGVSGTMITAVVLMESSNAIGIPLRASLSAEPWADAAVGVDLSGVGGDSAWSLAMPKSSWNVAQSFTAGPLGNLNDAVARGTRVVAVPITDTLGGNSTVHVLIVDDDLTWSIAGPADAIVNGDGEASVLVGEQFSVALTVSGPLGEGRTATVVPTSSPAGAIVFEPSSIVLFGGSGGNGTAGSLTTPPRFQFSARVEPDAMGKITISATATTDDPSVAVSLQQPGSSGGGTIPLTASTTTVPVSPYVVRVESEAPINVTLSMKDPAAPGSSNAFPLRTMENGTVAAVSLALAVSAAEPGSLFRRNKTSHFAVTLSSGDTTEIVPFISQTGGSSSAEEGLVARFAVREPQMGVFSVVPSAVTLRVSGVDDAVADGDVSVTVTAEARAVASNTSIVDLRVPTATRLVISAVNTDDDEAAVIVGQPVGHCAEDGTPSVFTVRLGSEPSTDVTVPVLVTSLDTSEVAVTPDSAKLLFTRADWSVDKTVTVRGVPDGVEDGLTGTVVRMSVEQGSTFGEYSDLAAEVTVVNKDMDAKGPFQAWPPNPEVVEGAAGATVSSTNVIKLLLNKQPESPVTIRVNAATPATGRGGVTANPQQVVVDNAVGAWDQLIPLTLVAIDDKVADDPRVVPITVTATGGSTFEHTVNVRVLDDDIAGVAFVVAAGCSVDETGSSTTVGVRLGSEPLSTVVVSVVSLDPSEAVISPGPSTLTFTPARWSTAQSVTVKGVADGSVKDGDVRFPLSASVVSSAGDPKYGVLPPVVSEDCVNIDVLWPLVAGVEPKTIELRSSSTVTVIGTDFDVAAVTLGGVPLEIDVAASGPSKIVAAWPGRVGTRRSRSRELSLGMGPPGVMMEVAAAPTRGATSMARPNLDIRRSVQALADTGENTIVPPDAAVVASALAALGSEIYVDLSVVNRGGGSILAPRAVYLAEKCADYGWRIAEDGTCEKCTGKGEVCPGGGRTQAGDGFFTFDEKSGIVVQCKPPERCDGATCAAGYKGDLCAQCDSGYYLSGKLCQPCGSALEVALSVFWSMLAIIVLMVLFVIASFVCADETFTDLIDAINALQLVQAVGKMSDPSLPSFMAEFYRMLGVLMLSFDFVSPGCFLGDSFRGTFLGTLALVFFAIVVCLVALVIGGFQLRSRRMLSVDPRRAIELRDFYKNRIVRVCVILPVLLYVNISTTMFQALYCERVGDVYYLVADFNMRCFEGDHIWIMAVALLFMIGYVLGLPAACFVTMRRLFREDKIHDPQHRARFGFLFEELKPKWYFFVTVALSVELSLVVVGVFLAGDTNTQGITAASLFFAYLALVAAARPYVRPVENALVALVAFVSLVASLLNVFASDMPYSARLSTSIAVFVMSLTALLVSIWLVAGTIIRKRRERRMKRQLVTSKLLRGLVGKAAIFADLMGKTGKDIVASKHRASRVKTRLSLVLDETTNWGRLVSKMLRRSYRIPERDSVFGEADTNLLAPTSWSPSSMPSFGNDGSDSWRRRGSVVRGVVSEIDVSLPGSPLPSWREDGTGGHGDAVFGDAHFQSVPQRARANYSSGLTEGTVPRVDGVGLGVPARGTAPRKVMHGGSAESLPRAGLRDSSSFASALASDESQRRVGNDQGAIDPPHPPASRPFEATLSSMAPNLVAGRRAVDGSIRRAMKDSVAPSLSDGSLSAGADQEPQDSTASGRHRGLARPQIVLPSTPPAGPQSQIDARLSLARARLARRITADRALGSTSSDRGTGPVRNSPTAARARRSGTDVVASSFSDAGYVPSVVSESEQSGAAIMGTNMPGSRNSFVRVTRRASADVGLRRDSADDGSGQSDSKQGQLAQARRDLFPDIARRRRLLARATAIGRRATVTGGDEESMFVNFDAGKSKDASLHTIGEEVEEE